MRRRKLFAAAVRVPAGEPLYVQLQIPAVRALNLGAARIQSVRRDVGAVKLLQAAAQLFTLPARGERYLDIFVYSRLEARRGLTDVRQTAEVRQIDGLGRERDDMVYRRLHSLGVELHRRGGDDDPAPVRIGLHALVGNAEGVAREERARSALEEQHVVDEL